ncbi:MAG: hypothetical protein GXY03_02000, partial [Solirubrobacterales bacterium]|nr:hypothetical protein [Solirubrobacterales bacterium]
MPDFSYVLSFCPQSGQDLDLDGLRGLAIADAVARARRGRGEAVAFAPVAGDDAPRAALEAFGIGYDWDAALAPQDPAVARWALWVLERLDAAGQLYQRGEEWRLRSGKLHGESEAALDRLAGWTPAALAAQRELLAHVDAPADGGDELSESLSKLAAAGWSVDNRKDKGAPEVHYAAGDLPVARGESWSEAAALHPRLTAALARLLAGASAEVRVGEPGAAAATWLPAALTVADRDSAEALLDMRTVARALRDAGALELADGEPLGPVLMHRPLRLKPVRRRPGGLGESGAGGGGAGANGTAAAAEAGATAATEPDPNDLVALAETHGPEAVRFALLHAAAPEKRFGGGADVVAYAERLLARLREHAPARIAGGADAEIALDDGLRRRLARWCEIASARMAQNYDTAALHRATRNAARLADRIVAFESLVADRRGTPEPADTAAIAAALTTLARLLEPLAPHTAGELLAAAGAEA